MKLLKRLLFTFLSLFVVYIGLCFLGPKSFESKNEIDISAPVNMVFDQIINLETWETWSPWVRQDSTMTIKYTDQKLGVGASYSWESELSGNGELIIDEANYPTNIKSKMSFDEWKGNSFSNWDLSVNKENKTHVMWDLETDRPIAFLVRGIMLLNGSQKKLEQGIEKGIKQLKSSIEEKYTDHPFAVQKTEIKERTFVTHRNNVSLNEITSYYKEHLGFLATAAMTKEVPMDGMPCGLFYQWNTATVSTDMAAAIPVDEVFDVNPGTFETIEGGKVLIVDHYGPYENLYQAHYALSGYAQENNLSIRMPIVEEYMNDPTLVNDVSDIHTRVYYYLK